MAHEQVETLEEREILQEIQELPVLQVGLNHLLETQELEQLEAVLQTDPAHLLQDQQEVLRQEAAALEVVAVDQLHHVVLLLDEESNNNQTHI
ncbi:MAG: hypothetical protein COA67_09820 [Lutibacter sp.]|nr:MAG: hypothetical protein COA67_09820 [Lutibacter sp.]